MTGIVFGELVLAEPTQPNSPPRLDVVAQNDFPAYRPGHRPVTIRFTYTELQAILNVYGRQVAAGHWRDYALDFLKDRALFSIYRRNSERPLFVIEKNPKLRQGQFLVTGQDGRILKRGHDLAAVLRVLEPKLSLVKG
jgi:hypothetical protein